MHVNSQKLIWKGVMEKNLLLKDIMHNNPLRTNVESTRWFIQLHHTHYTYVWIPLKFNLNLAGTIFSIAFIKKKIIKKGYNRLHGPNFLQALNSWLRHPNGSKYWPKLVHNGQYEPVSIHTNRIFWNYRSHYVLDQNIG